MDQINTQKHILEFISNFNKKNFRYLLSGKLSTSLILKYLISKHNLNPKLNEMLIPKFMGNWVYSNILQSIQTGSTFNNYTKIVYVYHQFGIPQKIEKIKSFADENKLILIEDCAHILNAKKKDQDLKVFNSDYLILSFSKFVNCSPLGGVISKDEEFLEFVDNEIMKSSKIQSIFINFLEFLSKSFKNNKSFKTKITNMNYSLWNYPSKTLSSKIKVFENKIQKERDERVKRFILLKDEIQNKLNLDYFEFEELFCQKLPITIDKENIREKIIQKFIKYKFPFEVLFYDINRNLLNPNFKKTIVLDHSRKNRTFEKQINTIKEIL